MSVAFALVVGIGLMLGVGLVLLVSPRLWPSREATPRARARSPLDLLRELLSRAGLPSLGVGTLVLGSAVLGIVAGALCFALVPVAILAGITMIVGFCFPTLLISSRARSRWRVRRVMWPDVVDHLLSAVRAGLALPDAVVTIANVGPPAARSSFVEFEREYRATGNFGRCVDSLKARLADPTADRLLETLRMSREVGGSELGTVLKNLSSHLRQESAIRSEVEARQSWVVNAAKLGAVAPWIILLLLASRPEAAAAYNSVAGVTIIVGGLVVTVIAYRVMLVLGRLPEERRWFR